MPSGVAASTVAPDAATSHTKVVPSPAFNAAQVAPPSFERYTPPAVVDA